MPARVRRRSPHTLFSLNPQTRSMVRERVIIVGIGCVPPQSSGVHTFIPLIEVQLAPARQHWQHICERFCPAATSFTRTCVESFPVRSVDPLTFCFGFPGLCYGQHRSLHSSWCRSDFGFNSRKHSSRYTQCMECKTGILQQEVYSGIGWFPS